MTAPKKKAEPKGDGINASPESPQPPVTQTLDELVEQAKDAAPKKKG